MAILLTRILRVQQFARMILNWPRNLGVSIYNLFRRGQEFPITAGMILNWARNLDVAIEQITKHYEWRVNQWSASGAAILTTFLGFISTVAVSSITEGVHPTRWKITFIVVGLVTLFLCYLIIMQIIDRIRHEYLQLYSLLQVLKKKFD